jgi:hypothetical protein
MVVGLREPLCFASVGVVDSFLKDLSRTLLTKDLPSAVLAKVAWKIEFAGSLRLPLLPCTLLRSEEGLRVTLLMFLLALQ